MKRLIALLLLLPALASAAPCLPPGCFLLTSGSLVAPVNDVGAGSFSFADDDSLLSGSTCFGMCLGATTPITIVNAGEAPRLSFEDGSFGSLGINQAIAGGVSWDPAAPGLPPPFEPGNAELTIAVVGPEAGPITVAGTFSAPFRLSASVIGQPSTAPPNPNGCAGLPPCQFVAWAGAGRVTYTVVPFTNENLPPGSAFQVTKVTYTLVPEPSTAALLLIALGALGCQAWARMRREQRV
jgi:hypothetical protein